MSNSNCFFCLKPETLLHVIAGCQSYLPRFTWIHDSVLYFIAKTLQLVSNSNLFVHLLGHENLSIIFSEFNLCTNVNRKRERYIDLIVKKP